MGGRYQAYPEYKDSGIEMLGDLPSVWKTKQVRYLLKDGAEGIKIGPFGSALKLEDMVDSGIRVYGQENVIKKDFSLGKRRISKDKFEEMEVYQAFTNDLLITMMGTSGKCDLVPDDAEIGIIDSHLLRLRVNESEILPGFFRLLIDECHEIENQIKVSGKGSIMHGLNSSIVKALVLPLPSRDEQELILGFLDHETAKIDTLIEKQQQLIKLLKEKRQAVISHAVTKGLNPDAPMRDSGVEWLGDVPEHWTVCKIKQVATMASGHTPDKKKEEYWVNCDIPWVSLNDSSQLKGVDYIRKTAFYLNDKGLANSSARRLPERCVVFTRDASIGLAAITIEVMAVSQHVIAWICDETKVIPEYLLLIFYAMQDELERYTFGATLKTIGMPDVNKLTGAFPSVTEQKEIIEHVFSEKEKFSVLISKAEKAVGIINERRTALVSAAVTGKIDVRNWEAPQQLNKEDAA
ncbi:MAG: restriction endonuclease subunit S [Sedimenticola sp.]